MNRFAIYQFDSDTFVVFDQREEREICVCSNYDDWTDAKERAQRIMAILNEDEAKRQKP